MYCYLHSQVEIFTFFTAWSSYASAVLGIVILSVCQTRALWRNERTYCRYFDITRKGNHSSYWYQQRLVGNVLIVMGNSKNLHAFNFVIVLKPRKFDAHEIHLYYITWPILHSTLRSHISAVSQPTTSQRSPRYRLSYFAWRAFSVAGPSVWNS